jgi:hypothetical protein
MNKVTFDDFQEKLSYFTRDVEDDYKLEIYEDLLETGSTQIGDGYQVIIFSIVNGFEYEIKEIENDPNAAELSHEDIKEIDDIVNSDVEDDLIDLSVLQKEADELEEDYRELTDEELIEIGIDPNTKKPIEIEFVINQLESLELNSTEMITEDGDCQIWKDDVIALKYALVIIKTLKQLRYK